jgi:hypothetical protein
MKTAKEHHDVDLSLHGSIDLLTPLTAQAQAWMKENIPNDVQWFGGALAVEPRYATDIVQGMIDDGLTVFIGDGQVTSVLTRPSRALCPHHRQASAASHPR